MNKTKRNIRKVAIPAEFIGQFYLDPRYDTAFKELFDDKNALKNFLNGALNLKGKDRIRKITYTFDKSLKLQPSDKKKVVLDIFVTTGTGRFIDIEMQKAEHDYFIDRAVLYKAALTTKGKREMDRSKEFLSLPKKEREKRRYELPESVAIWICDFELPGIKNDNESYVDEWFLCSSLSLAQGAPVSIFPKNKYIIISLPNFKKTAEEVKNSLEAWLFLLKHANEGKELPTFGNPTIKDALDRIRVNNATEDMFMSQLSEKKRQDEYNTRLASAVLKAEAAAKEAAKEAAKKAAKEAAKKAAKKAAKEATKNITLEIAMTMLKRKYGINEIISICSLSSKEVLKLKASLEKG